MELGERIRQRRLAMCYSQAVLAEQAGIGTAELSAIETGKIEPPAFVLVRIAGALECTVSELCEMQPIPVNSYYRDLHKLCARLNGHQKELLLEIAWTFAQNNK